MNATYVTARSVEEAVAAMAAGARPVAGGTDLVVGARQGKAPLPQHLVGVHRIPDMARINEADGAGGLQIGALVTHETLATHPGIRARFTGLADACSIIGSHATRANGTIGGNVMNASPAMDTGAPLLCHGALAVLRSPRGERRLELDGLWTGPGQVSAGSDELMVALELPAPAAGKGMGTGSGYVRLQYRRQMEIAIVGAAAVVTLTDGVVSAARVAITALAPTIRRVHRAEVALLGTSADPNPLLHVPEAASVAGARAAEAALPISDVRGSAAYRRAMAAVVTRRAVTVALARAAGVRIAVPASEFTWGNR